MSLSNSLNLKKVQLRSTTYSQLQIKIFQDLESAQWDSKFSLQESWISYQQCSHKIFSLELQNIDSLILTDWEAEDITEGLKKLWKRRIRISLYSDVEKQRMKKKRKNWGEEDEKKTNSEKIINLVYPLALSKFEDREKINSFVLA